MAQAIPILYQDEDLLAVNKPPRVVVVGALTRDPHSLMERVNRLYRVEGRRWFPCHRLDRETSGVVLCARGRSVQQRMRTAFEKRRIRKAYILFVQGRMAARAGEIRRPVKDFFRRRYRASVPGEPARTRFRVIRARPEWSVVLAEPITGRTHQIRIHFQQMGHPLLGERIYARGRDFDVKFRRVALHSAVLEGPHPTTGRRFRVEAPLAEDMKQWLQTHRLWGPTQAALARWS